MTPEKMVSLDVQRERERERECVCVSSCFIFLRVVRCVDDDELMLNVLRCHLTY